MKTDNHAKQEWNEALDNVVFALESAAREVESLRKDQRLVPLDVAAMVTRVVLDAAPMARVDKLYFKADRLMEQAAREGAS